MPIAAKKNQVFINCPFDGKYKNIFNALVFAIHDCGFIARCALEANDSHHVRIDKIFKIIGECSLGVHDISRAGIDSTTKLARFNMPLELGIFMGCKEYSDNAKCYLIFDLEKYRYQKFISDISGQDIKIHEGKIEKAISGLRDWLNNKTKETLPSGSVIHKRYLNFIKELPKMCRKNKWKPNELTFVDYTTAVASWLIEVT